MKMANFNGKSFLASTKNREYFGDVICFPPTVEVGAKRSKDGSAFLTSESLNKLPFATPARTAANCCIPITDSIKSSADFKRDSCPSDDKPNSRT